MNTQPNIMRIMTMLLSPHFSLGELVASDTAARLGINNTPSPEVVANLERLCVYLEVIRSSIGQPILVSSGYRCSQLNKAVGGVVNSAHLLGRAADIHVVGMISTDLTGYIADNCPGFDQVIDEQAGAATWTHVGIEIVGSTPRGQVLRARMVNGTMAYTGE